MHMSYSEEREYHSILLTAPSLTIASHRVIILANIYFFPKCFTSLVSSRIAYSKSHIRLVMEPGFELESPVLYRFIALLPIVGDHLVVG